MMYSDTWNSDVHSKMERSRIPAPLEVWPWCPQSLLFESRGRDVLIFLHQMVVCIFLKHFSESLGESRCNGGRYSLIFSSLDSHCIFEMEIMFREAFVFGNVRYDGRIYGHSIQSSFPFSPFLCYFQTQLR